MRRQAAFPITGGMLCLMAATVAAGAQPGTVAPPAGPALAPRTHGFMLYLSQPLGGGGGGGALHPKFGFRIDQVRMAGNSGAPDAGDPMQRRSLVGWQFGGGSGLHASDVKLELGGRLTYDVTHGGFGAQLSRSGVSTNTVRPVSTVAVSEPKSFELHGLQFRGADSHGPEEGARPFTHDLFHEAREANESSSVFHEVAAAAIATFKSSHNVPIQQRSRPSERPFLMQEAR
jgi:hypothetical protein